MTPLRKEETKLNYSCRVCQPEVTPTRLSKAGKQHQENFWRCTRHQPGASYRLDVCRGCKKKCEVNENDEWNRTMIVEPEEVRKNSNSVNCNVVNETTVSSLMKKLVRSWKERVKGLEETEETLWDLTENDEKSPKTNLICCRCSCPYLRPAPRLDYEEYDWDAGMKKELCKKCVCPKCLNQRERRVKEKNNFSKHEVQVANQIHQRAGRFVDKGKISRKMKQSGKFKGDKEREVIEKMKVHRDTPTCIDESLKDEKTDSGFRADVSDCSKLTNIPTGGSSVTSATFLTKVKKNRQQPSGLTESNYRSAMIGGNNNGKKSFSENRHDEENQESWNCLDPRGKSEFKKMQPSISETRRVTYDTSDTTRIADNNLSEEDYEAPEDFEVPDESLNDERYRVSVTEEFVKSVEDSEGNDSPIRDLEIVSLSDDIGRKSSLQLTKNQYEN